MKRIITTSLLIEKTNQNQLDILWKKLPPATEDCYPFRAFCKNGNEYYSSCKRLGPYHLFCNNFGRMQHPLNRYNIVTTEGFTSITNIVNAPKPGPNWQKVLTTLMTALEQINQVPTSIKITI